MLQATLRPKAAINSKKNIIFTFSHTKDHMTKFDLGGKWVKVNPGSLLEQLVLPYTMLHTEFQGHWSVGSGEEDFLRVLPYMGMAAILIMRPNSFV